MPVLPQSPTESSTASWILPELTANGIGGWFGAAVVLLPSAEVRQYNCRTNWKSGSYLSLAPKACLASRLRTENMNLSLAVGRGAQSSVNGYAAVYLFHRITYNLVVRKASRQSKPWREGELS